MSKITIDNQKVNYREWGNGDTVILMLHGWPADSTHYSDLGPMLGKMGYRVIVPDLPGWGETSAPQKAWNVSDYRDWLDKFVKELDLKQFVLFGHSFGGRIAIKYAINYPYRLSTLILCAAAGIKPDAQTLKRRTLKMTAAVGKKAFSLPLINKLAPLARKVLYRAAGSTDYLKAQGVMKETIVKVLEEDLAPLLPQLSQTTLILWGTDDGATPITDAHKMNEIIPRSEMKTFEGMKHNLPKLIPKEVSQAIDEFLKDENNSIIE